MFCPRCGRHVAPDAGFCGECGAALPPPRAEDAPPTTLDAPPPPPPDWVPPSPPGVPPPPPDPQAPPPQNAWAPPPPPPPPVSEPARPRARPPYPQGQPGGGVQALAVVALACSILGILSAAMGLCCLPFGVIGLLLSGGGALMGGLAPKSHDPAIHAPSSLGLAKAGLFCGIGGVLIAVLTMGVGLLFLGLSMLG